MDKLEKMLKEHSSSVEVPEHYKARVKETLKSLPDATDEEPASKNKFSRMRKFGVAMAAVAVLVVAVAVVDTTADANIFTTFRQTIMKFLNVASDEKEELGVESKKDNEKSKPDIMAELLEKVVDRDNIYLMIKITASTDIQFDDKVSFDYFAFCKGENQNNSDLIGGVRSFKLAEVKPDKKNEAIFVMQISADEKIEDGSMITAYMKDLMSDPDGSGRKMLVEGMWSITFEADYTVKKDINIKGTKDMSYAFMKKRAYVKNLTITPLGMSIKSDVSEVPAEVMNVSDTSLEIRLKMLDGKEILIMSHDFEKKTAVKSASASYSNKGKKVYQKNKFEFEKTLNINRILGVYIDDLYIPVIKTDDD